MIYVFLVSFQRDDYILWHLKMCQFDLVTLANAFSSDLNSICRNEVQTSRFEDTKRGAIILDTHLSLSRKTHRDIFCYHQPNKHEIRLS